MSKKKRTGYCPQCHEESECYYRRKRITQEIKGKKYVFCIAQALCGICRKPIDVDWVTRQNQIEIAMQYRLYQIEKHLLKKGGKPC